MIKLSKSTIVDAKQAIANGAPVFSTERGSLYRLSDSTGFITLRIPQTEYAQFTLAVEEDKKPKGIEVLLIENQDIKFFVFGKIEVEKGVVILNNRPVVIL